MPAFDQYAIYHEDRTLRLVQPMDIRSQSHEVVRVGTRKFDELINAGYRIRNPQNASAHHRHAAIGLNRVAALTVPGYALLNEMVGGHGSHSRHSNPSQLVETSVGYAPWAAVTAMQRRAREAGHPELVKVFTEADAKFAHDRASAAIGKGMVPSRFVLGVFVVTDRPRITGYAPHRWIEEEADRAMEEKHEANDRKVQAAIDRTEKIKDDFKEKVKQASANVQSKIMPQLEKLEKAVDAHVAKIEKKGPNSTEAKMAGEKVKTVAAEAKRQFSLLKVAKGAGRGFMRGWRGDDITWGPGIRGGKR